MFRTDEQRRAHIQALLREREGYVQRGDLEHVALVDIELRRVGHSAKAPAKRAVKMTARKSTEL